MLGISPCCQHTPPWAQSCCSLPIPDPPGAFWKLLTVGTPDTGQAGLSGSRSLWRQDKNGLGMLLLHWTGSFKVVLGVQCLEGGMSSLLLGTAKAEVGLAGRESSEDEGKCRRMGVSDGFVAELLFWTQRLMRPGPSQVTAMQPKAEFRGAQVSLSAIQSLSACETLVKCHSIPSQISLFHYKQGHTC